MFTMHDGIYFCLQFLIERRRASKQTVCSHKLSHTEINMAGYNYSNNNEDERRGDDNEGKLFVGGLAWESNEDSIRTYFEQWGPIESVTLKKNKEDPTKHRGFAFIKFKNAHSAEDVLSQKEPHVLDGSRIDPKSACPLGVKPEQRTKKIFVGGLQAETTDEKLRDYFSQFGEIMNNIEYAIDHNTKKKRGFCFIEFASEGIVDRIVKDKYHEIAGKRLETKRALSKQQQQELAASQGTNRGAPRSSAQMYSLPMAASPYAQPVIYIHPDSLSTAYPLSAMGVSGLTAAYQNTAPAYASALETIYTPYNNRDNNRHGAVGSRGQRHDPYRK